MMNYKKSMFSLISLILLVFASCSNSQTTENRQQSIETIPQKFSEPAESIIKTETVYVNLDYSGNVQKVNVSDWIHTDRESVYVDDISSLENIMNIKGEVKPETVNGFMRWHMEDTDLYYTGTTEKSPPVSFSVEYYLNGELISPEKLSGMNGKITINIKIKNNELKKVIVSGKEYIVSLPVIAVGGMILPESVFSDINVKNAQSFSDGTKHLVAFASMPGFTESLGFVRETFGGLAEMITAQEITVSAYAENFSLENMYFAVVPLASLNFDMVLPETVDDVKTAVTVLKSFRDAVNKLDPDRIIYSLISDEKKVNSLINAVNDASTLYDNNRNLIELINKYSTPENADIIRNLLDTLNTPEVQAMLSVISDPEVQSFITGLPIIIENFGNVTPLLEELQNDLSRPEIQAEIDALPETVNSLSEITGVISENEKEIDAILSAFDEGGAHTLETLLESINPEDLAGLEDKYGNAVEDSDLIVALVEEWLKFGSEYGIFTESADNMSTSLMFIYKTSAIKRTAS